MLPKIEHPVYRIEVPSLGKKYSFRPFLVREEKLLLMAKESKNPTDILSAIRQIVTNCCIDKLDIDTLALFDLEYIFLQLRAHSIDNVVNVSYRDDQDDKVYDFDINLHEVKVEFPKETPEKVVEVSKTAGLIMKYPSAQLYGDKEFLATEEDHYFSLIIRCVDKVYNGEEVFEASDIPTKEMEEFLEDLSLEVFNNVQEFLVNTPKIEYKLEYQNSLGTKREIHLNTLDDFFTWR